MERELGTEESFARGRVAGMLGAASFALLVASFRWAHHWSVRADAIVAAWTLATIAAPLVAVWSLRTSRASRRLAKLGIALTLVSLLALALAGLLYAAGVDAAGACGGG